MSYYELLNFQKDYHEGSHQIPTQKFSLSLIKELSKEKVATDSAYYEYVLRPW